MKAYPIIAGVTFGLALAVVAVHGTFAARGKNQSVFALPSRIAASDPPVIDGDRAALEMPSMRTPRCIMGGLESVPKYLATPK